MLGPSWVALFRRIPVNLQDVLIMITVTGSEIILQKILVMEDDYFIFRGRMSGSQDGGLVIIMPYDQISNVCFNKRMLEPEVAAIFGNADGFMQAAPTAAGTADTRPAVVSQGAVNAVAVSPGTALAAQAPSIAAEPSKALEETVVYINSKPALPESTTMEPNSKDSLNPKSTSKSTLLARLRARLAGQAKA